MNRVLQPKTIFSFENNDNFNTESTVKVTPPSKTKRRKINGDAPRASWKHPAILRLIYHYKENIHIMNGNLKRHEEVWQDISDALVKQGYNFSHLQCEDKWKYKKLYVDTIDKNKQSGTPENTCPYFNEFDEIYGKSHSVNPPALASNRALTNSPTSEISTVSVSDSDEKESIAKKKKSRNSKQLDLWTDIFRNGTAKVSRKIIGFAKKQMQTQNALLAKILEKL
ncbi:hypothetical protein ACS0PU_010459 [Formica fusca]